VDVRFAYRGLVGKGVQQNFEQIWPYLFGILLNSFPNFSSIFCLFFLSHSNTWGKCVQHSATKQWLKVDKIFEKIDKRSCGNAHLDMGWLRRVGSFKLQVSFAKEFYKRDDILLKSRILLRRLLIVATPQGPSRCASPRHARNLILTGIEPYSPCAIG